MILKSFQSPNPNIACGGTAACLGWPARWRCRGRGGGCTSTSSILGSSKYMKVSREDILSKIVTWWFSINYPKTEFFLHISPRISMALFTPRPLSPCTPWSCSGLTVVDIHRATGATPAPAPAGHAAVTPAWPPTQHGGDTVLLLIQQLQQQIFRLVYSLDCSISLVFMWCTNFGNS